MILNLTNLILLIKYLTISQRTYKLKTANLTCSRKIAQTHIDLNYGSFLNPTKLRTTKNYNLTLSYLTLSLPVPLPSNPTYPQTTNTPQTLLSHWLPNSRAHSHTLTCSPHDSRSLIALLTITDNNVLTIRYPNIFNTKISPKSTLS